MPLTYRQMVAEATAQLHKAGIDSAALDARVLLQYVTGFTREGLLRAWEDNVTVEHVNTYSKVLARRAECYEPVANITGIREFWGRDFYTTADTLEPRPDTETLITTLLSVFPNKTEPLRILDCGTGTGCLAITALAEYPYATGLAIDASHDALAVAQKNALHHEVADRMVCEQWNWEQLTVPSNITHSSWDVIMSNPPYIPSQDMVSLAEEVRNFDPILALDGGADGLDAYRHLLPRMADWLAPRGHILLELGIGQAEDVRKIAEKHNLQHVQTTSDLAGIPRCLHLCNA